MRPKSIEDGGGPYNGEEDGAFDKSQQYCYCAGGGAGNNGRVIW